MSEAESFAVIVLIDVDEQKPSIAAVALYVPKPSISTTIVWWF
jgi:hypothetical protein